MRLFKDFTGIGRRPASANSSDSHRPRPDSYRARRHRCTLGLERLEDRVALSNFVSSNLASFNGATGSGPRAGLIMDAQGNLYGTTDGGGANGHGTVFELAAGSGTITTLASFNGANGAYPEAGLIMDAQGNLYGTTSNGGAFDDNGTVFELAAGSGTITTLASFNGANGHTPRAGLIMDAQGNLYGTTAMAPGAPGRGTVFELAAGSGTITTLASFNGANGVNPEAGLILDAQGNLYGTTYFGGAFGQGTVFELSPVPVAPPPVVTAFSPAAGATGVDPNNFKATVTFDQPVQIAGMGSPGNFSLHSTSGEGPALHPVFPTTALRIRRRLLRLRLWPL